jgi:hypothetical protein
MDRAGRIVSTILLVLALAGGLALPWMACARDSRVAPFALSARLAYGLGHLVCHQRPERSFFSCGRPWPVCGRCAGLYLGAALGALAGLVFWKPKSDEAWWRRTLVVVAAPTAALWALEAGTGIDPGSLVRCAGAIPLGLGAAGWLAAIRRGDLR